ncbi:AAA domain-containing protein [Planctomycetales bacterium ZRK34]|nr:AAA domain-containing protein [Planctomycetales bacterium ZRK34]
MTQTQIPPHEAIDLKATAQAFERVRTEVNKIVIGQPTVIEQILTALLGRGHCLLIGVPGLAKTVMAKAVADALDMQFNRIQFTPDLMPSDITGTNVLEHDPDTGAKEFRFIPGPVFTNILLADEINRTPPKTQASLLEAMQERQVTFGGERRALPAPFFTLATQNPLEQEGTYPLPEAQLDRFMFSVIVSYTSHADENRIILSTTQPNKARIQKVLGAEQIVAMQKLVRQMDTPPEVVRYATALMRATRPAEESSPDFIKKFVDCGAGPRAGQYLVLAAKSRAVMMGRAVPLIEDVRASANAVLRHRMFTNFTALSENITPDALVDDLIKAVPAPSDKTQIVYNPPEPDDEPLSLDDHADPVELIRSMSQITQRIRSEVQQVIVGQHDVLDLVTISLLASGHCLLVGVPGLAKTLLVQTLSDVMDLNFKRVQFTPDLMPSDITGTDVMESDEKTGHREFRFIPGPIFANILLADEINRTPPKTQAALLEAMQERSVTTGGKTYPLTPPFLTLATQNPLEQEGTYPLPEAQLDRFMFNIHLDYPSLEEETVIIDRTTGFTPRQPKKVIGAAEIIRLQKVVRRVPISSHVLTYVTSLVRATRPQTKGAPKIIEKYVHCGAGPRAAQNLVLGAKARAVMQGRVNVGVADVRAVAVPVLRHRIFTNFLADAEGVTPMSIVEELIRILPEPAAKDQKQLQAEAAAQTRAAMAEHAEQEQLSEESAEREAEAPVREEKQTEPETLSIRCPNCGQLAELPHTARGKKAKCWDCQQVFVVDECLI